MFGFAARRTSVSKMLTHTVQTTLKDLCFILDCIVMVAFRKGNPFKISVKSRSFGRRNIGPIWPDLTNGRFSSPTLRAFSSTPPFRRYVAEPCGTAITPKVMGYQVAEDEQELAQNEFTNLTVLRSSFRKSNIS